MMSFNLFGELIDFQESAKSVLSHDALIIKAKDFYVKGITLEIGFKLDFNHNEGTFGRPRDVIFKVKLQGVYTEFKIPFMNVLEFSNHKQKITLDQVVLREIFSNNIVKYLTDFKI